MAILLTVIEFVLIVSGICIFSLSFGYWAGKLRGRADEQMTQFYKRLGSRL